jgi:serine/threonine protein kinase
LDDITQWNLAWQKKLLSQNEDVIADAMIPMNEFQDPQEIVKRGSKVIKKLRKGEEVALKQRIFDREEKKQINDILSQVIILKKLKESQYIVKFYGFVKNEDELMYMVTEWCEYGNLKEYYTSYGSLDWHEKSRIAIDIARGLTFLHTVSILHHDIRSENILITRHRCAKLANFTLSRGFRDFSTHVKATIDNVRWMAPEKLKDHNNTYTAKCEIYSFGMVLWEIAEERLPFQSENDIVQIRDLVVNQKHRPSFSLGVPSEWIKIANQGKLK